MFFLDGKCNSSRRLPLGYVGAIIDRPHTAPPSFLSFRETQEARDMGIRVFGRSVSAPYLFLPTAGRKKGTKNAHRLLPNFRTAYAHYVLAFIFVTHRRPTALGDEHIRLHGNM